MNVPRGLNDVVRPKVMDVPPTIADCDPVTQYRNLINSGLSIKGRVAAPTKINMGMIQPVYIINPFPCFNDVMNRYQLTLGGTNNVQQPIADADSLNVELVNIKSLSILINYTTAVARAAAAAATHHVTLSFQYCTTAVLYEIGRVRWIVGAFAGHGALLHYSNRNMCTDVSSLSGNENNYNVAPKYTFLFEKELTVRKGYYFQVLINNAVLGDTNANFPADVTAEINAHIEY